MTPLLLASRSRLQELLRRPTTVVLVLAVPPLVIEMYGVALESFPALPTVQGDPASVGRRTGTLFAVAFLAGLVGLFEVISARQGDERLTVSGFSRRALLGGHVVALVVIALVASTAAGAVLWWRTDVAAPGLGFSVLLLAGVLYGLLGVVVGSVLPRDLEGSLLLVFMADLDNALASGLFDVGGARDLVPLRHPHALFESAIIDGSLPLRNLLWTLVWIGALALIALLLHRDVVREDVPW